MDVSMRALVWLILPALAAICVPVPASAQDLVPLFRKVSPSVGVIRAKGRDVTASGQVRFNETGSGVLISNDGKMMTAAHVVDAMDEISVEFLGGETVPARVVVSYSMSVGWISARWPPNTVYKTMPLAEFFQTDATINTGNSGGPMFDLAGEVIGIVSHNISKGGGSEGLGFVVTINTAKQLLLDKKSFWGGVEGQILTDHLADLLNLPAGATGFLIKNVAKGSPADQMGLRGGTTYATIDGQPIVLGGDVLLTVAGIPAGSAANLARIRDLLGAAKPGTEFKGTVLRAGRVLEMSGRVP
jgi:S1-C subfamily serine protease